MPPPEASLAAASAGVPLAAAALLPFFRCCRAPLPLLRVGAVAAATATALLVGALFLLAERPVGWSFVRAPEWGFAVEVRVDRLALLFALPVAGIGLLSVLYSLGYMPHWFREARAEGDEPLYLSAMLLFSGAMLGLLFAGNLLLFYVFWELTGIASFLLIGLAHRADAGARRAAMQALGITAGGGVALLLALLWLGANAGSFSLAEALARAPREALGSPAGSAAPLLLVLAAATKSAQAPFHLWLPRAMVAPTPVSAFLHSAALVAAGVYLLARCFPLLAGSPLAGAATTAIGAVSLLVGALLALQAREMKELLAGSTISQYGAIFALLGMGDRTALAAALFSFLLHAAMKAGLFFAAGTVTHATGATALRETGSGGLGFSRTGWRARGPAWVAAAGALLALSLGGVPPLAGFWMKELLLKEALEANPGLATVALLGGALSLLYMLRFLAGALVEDPAPAESAMSSAERAPATLVAVPAILAATALLLGLWPQPAGALAADAAADAAGPGAALDLAVHADMRLLLSLLALAAGAGIFLAWGSWAPRLAALRAASGRIGPMERVEEGAARLAVAAGQTCLRLQSGDLPGYVTALLAALVALAGIGLLLHGRALPLPDPARLAGPWAPMDLPRALLLLLIALGAVATLLMRRRLHLVITLGVVGYAIAGLFSLLFAPDVALVQVHVETLATILLALGLARIPESVRGKVRLGAQEQFAGWKLALAGLGGAGTFWAAWLALEHLPPAPIASWYLEHSERLTHARDIVAALLVDFRALDTLGEITVFATAAAGVYALTRLIRRLPG